MGKRYLEPEYMLSSKGKRQGPFTEAELITLAYEGRVKGKDRILDPVTNRWMKASRVPWLHDRQGKSLREAGTPAWIQGVALLLVVVAFIGILVLRRDTSLTSRPIDLGVIPAPDPAPSSVIRTETWGLIPPGRLNIRLYENGTRADADRVAQAVDGTVVGEMPILGLYMIDHPARSEREFRDALTAATSQEGVKAAFPEQVAFVAAPGTRCTPLDDPVYAGGLARPQEMTGVQAAWDLLRASALRLHRIKVGIVDDGLYVGQGEFDGNVHIETRTERDRLSTPMTDAAGGVRPGYSHGTGVASVLAADPDDGGVTGIASVLGDKLIVSMSNTFYGGIDLDARTDEPPPDPTEVVARPRGSFVVNDLAVIQMQIQGGARVINLSWSLGADPTDRRFDEFHTDVYRAYRDFFRRMAGRHPDVVFVCSAGNQGGTPEDGAYLPAGIDAPNVITVGNLNNDGGIEGTRTNVMSLGRTFHVDLAAPGQQIVYGVDAEGRAVVGGGGTSMAASQVTATVAILKAIHPSLQCKEIKEILLTTARREIERADGGLEAVPRSVGAGCLAVDRAVLEVINRRRAARGEEGRLAMEDLLPLARVALEAVEGEGGQWAVSASVPRIAQATTMLTIRPEKAKGLGGSTTVTVTPGQEARWMVAPDGVSLVHVERSDTGACWSVRIGTVRAELTASPPSGRARDDSPLTIRLSAAGSESVSGAITQYEWDLDGDGTYESSTSTPDAPAPLELTAAGAYEVGVRVTDPEGRTAEARTSITVEPPRADPNAARILELETLIRRNREQRIRYLGQIEKRREAGTPSPEQDEKDREAIETVIEPAYQELLEELNRLRAER